MPPAPCSRGRSGCSTRLRPGLQLRDELHRRRLDVLALRARVGQLAARGQRARLLPARRERGAGGLDRFELLPLRHGGRRLADVVELLLERRGRVGAGGAEVLPLVLELGLQPGQLLGECADLLVRDLRLRERGGGIRGELRLGGPRPRPPRPGASSASARIFSSGPAAWAGPGAGSVATFAWAAAIPSWIGLAWSGTGSR